VKVPELWAGTDAGKAAHHCTVIDADGKRRLSRRVANHETELLKLIADVLELSDSEPVTWASSRPAAWTWLRTAPERSTECGPAAGVLPRTGKGLRLHRLATWLKEPQGPQLQAGGCHSR
jgi:hypothetical protein